MYTFLWQTLEPVLYVYAWDVLTEQEPNRYTISWSTKISTHCSLVQKQSQCSLEKLVTSFTIDVMSRCRILEHNDHLHKPWTKEKSIQNSEAHGKSQPQFKQLVLLICKLQRCIEGGTGQLQGQGVQTQFSQLGIVCWQNQSTESSSTYNKSFRNIP